MCNSSSSKISYNGTTFDKKVHVKSVKELSKLNSFKSMQAIACEWLAISACLIYATIGSNFAILIICFFLIATRQHALGILMHEASHFRLCKSRKLNDFLGNCFLAYPIFISTEVYRTNHLAHHNHIHTEEDPDLARRKDDNRWVFPKKEIDIVKILLRDLFFGAISEQIRAVRSLSKKQKSVEGSGQSGSDYFRPIYYITLALLFTVTGSWITFLIFWILPLFTVLPCLLRIRSMARHFGLPHQHELNHSRNYAGPFWERILIAPHNVGYHLDHHMFPSVPFYNLPKLNLILLQDSSYRALAHRNSSIFGRKGRTVQNDLTYQSEEQTENSNLIRV